MGMASKMRAAKVVEPVKAEPWGCIYHAVNLRNSKGYVGQYCKPETERRWAAHLKDARRGSCTYFHRALRKNKYEAGFSWEVIWRGPVSRLNEMETYFIAKLHTFASDPLGGGYNLTMGGGTPTVIADCVRKRLSEASKQQHADPVMKARLSAIQKQVWKRPELRATLSLAQKKLWENSAYRTSRLLTSAQKAARSASIKLWWASPGIKDRLSQAQKCRRERERKLVSA